MFEYATELTQGDFAFLHVINEKLAIETGEICWIKTPSKFNLLYLSLYQ